MVRRVVPLIVILKSYVILKGTLILVQHNHAVYSGIIIFVLNAIKNFIL